MYNRIWIYFLDLASFVKEWNTSFLVMVINPGLLSGWMNWDTYPISFSCVAGTDMNCDSTSQHWFQRKQAGNDCLLALSNLLAWESLKLSNLFSQSWVVYGLECIECCLCLQMYLRINLKLGDLTFLGGFVRKGTLTSSLAISLSGVLAQIHTFHIA